MILDTSQTTPSTTSLLETSLNNPWDSTRSWSYVGSFLAVDGCLGQWNGADRLYPGWLMIERVPWVSVVRLYWLRVRILLRNNLYDTISDMNIPYGQRTFASQEATGNSFAENRTLENVKEAFDDAE